MSPYNVPVKSVHMHYQQEDGSYEMIPANPGIHHFIWEHCIVLNHILQHLENVGATVSTTKFILATLTAVIVGHMCTFEGRVPDDSKVQKIHDWPVPKNAMQVHGFLGMCSVLLLINLTKKDIPFEFGPKHYEAMQILKESILESPALQCLDYECGCKVILAVDTSNIAV